MYAVFEDGSRQYRVSEGATVTVDYREAEAGSSLEFNRVLLYTNGTDTRIGQPYLDGMRIVTEIVDHPSTKVVMMKYRKRKNSRRTKGHRQWYTKVRIKHILLPGAQPPASAPEKKEEKPAEAASSAPAPVPATS